MTKRNKWFLKGGRGSGKTFRLLWETYENKIEELEKENEKLKETLKTYNGCGDWDNDFHACRVYLQHEELQMYIDQLTKAKEIIKELLSCCRNYPQENAEKMEQAEQFLKADVGTKNY